ncbi:MAG: HlyD family type I secretion periplasmic adaptor subunit [Pseudomonadota bacterium]
MSTLKTRLQAVWLTRSRAGSPVAENPARAGLSASIAGPARLALLVLFLVFGVGGAFAVLVPITSAVVATGVVNTVGDRRTVQHPSGGVIAALPVTEGDQVAAGDVVAVIEDTTAQSALGVLRTRLIQAIAEENRLMAEQAGVDQIQISHPLIVDRDDPTVTTLLRSEAERFRSRHASHRTRLGVLDQRILQQERQIAGLSEQLSSVREQAAITRDELVTLERLYKRRLVPRPRIQDARRRSAELDGRLGALDAQIAQAEEAIGETRLQIAALEDSRRSDIDADLALARSTRLQLEDELQVRTEQLDRTRITSPVDGIVTNLQVRTVGGVVGAGDAIMDIVPSTENLIIEAEVSPVHVDDVVVGQSAYVVFPSLPQRMTPRVFGTVKSVSPDTYERARDGSRYYRALIEVDDSVAMGTGDQRWLAPGMPAEVFMTARSRSFASYLTEPLTAGIGRTFREM